MKHLTIDFVILVSIKEVQMEVKVQIPSTFENRKNLEKLIEQNVRRKFTRILSNDKQTNFLISMKKVKGLYQVSINLKYGKKDLYIEKKGDDAFIVSFVAMRSLKRMCSELLNTKNNKRGKIPFDEAMFSPTAANLVA